MPGMSTGSRIFLSLLSFLILVLAAAAGGTGFAVYNYTGPGPLEEEKAVLIERGSGVRAIADTLARENVMRYPLLFKIAARLTDAHADLKAGEYLFPARVPMAAVLRMLREGDVLNRSVTIPEGLTSFQIVRILNRVEALEGDIAHVPEEGSLLPETYQYIKGDTRSDKIARMQAAMKETLEELWPARVDGLPFGTLEEAVTLASIVEKETGVAKERRRVAGVFLNRLRKGIALQSDPTVIYALTGGEMKEDGQGPLGRRLLKKDLETDSPYNTYKYPGLPPGPIANPGRASLEAVLNPEEHDFLYFVADGTGGHVFAKTLAEHNANVARWRKIRRER